MIGLTTRFSTAVGTLSVPRDVISSAIFYHLTNDDYEVPELGLLQTHLSADDRVIELGAGIGFLANFYGRRCAHQRHLAIEANPVMSALVRTNTQSLANVDVLNALAARPADGASPGQAPLVPFYICDDFWASSTEPPHSSDPTRRVLRTVHVPMVDLDALIAERRCTMLVCDIEGGEYDLVHTFDLAVPKILMELHWRTLGLSRALHVMQTLESRGYRLTGSPDVLMAIKS